MPRTKPSTIAHTRFGYGVVDKLGEPYWAEDSICEDRGVLQSEVVDWLNSPSQDARKPYRVVTLYRRGKKVRPLPDASS